MTRVINFGEQVDGYLIPVLNEREIRAAAGIMFVLMLISFMNMVLVQNFTLLKYSVSVFMLDFVIRVFVNPKYSPTLIFGRIIVRKQAPEYVGAPQKKFAWVIGVVLSVVFFMMTVVMNTCSPITNLICMLCMVFLFFESAFGICLGCKLYPLFFRAPVQLCAGDVCETKVIQEINKISCAQRLVIFLFVMYVALMIVFLNENFSQPPIDIFGVTNPAN
ncbi:MAG: DUF4395 domain-containing protein [Gammaproteobacteria bacterium]|nr:DUF4395 domain-containing protein [Gammaproteobacteria bacterium]